MSRQVAILDHYASTQSAEFQLVQEFSSLSSRYKDEEEFSVFSFAPSAMQPLWLYMTVGMTTKLTAYGLELHIYSAEKDSLIVDLLVNTISFHRHKAILGLDHTVNFGRPWVEGSSCSYGLLSLPYVLGQNFVEAEIEGQKVRFLWLLPITEAERNYKKSGGVESLEQKFEEIDFEYWNPFRDSVV